VIPAPGSYRASSKSIGDPTDIQRLADILAKAERPAVLMGQQVWASQSHHAAIEFIRAMDIPAYMNGASRGMLPQDDPHHFDRTRSDAFKGADVILIVGTPFDFRMGYGKRISKDATLVQIDQDYRTVGKNRDISLGLAGDPGAILSAVVAAASVSMDNGARQLRKQWMAQLRAFA
jgi:acetolactate synthase I/II/III large subunit